MPTDEAFEKIPHHGDKKPSPEFLERLVKYHIGLGFYPTRRLLGTPTLPSLLEEKWLGDNPQRLRTSFGLGGLRVNFYSKIVAGNFVRFHTLSLSSFSPSPRVPPPSPCCS